MFIFILFFIFLFSSLTDMQDTLKMLLVKAIDLYTKFMAYDFISWYMGRYVQCISDRMNAQTVPMHYNKIIYVIKPIHITPMQKYHYY